MSCKSALMLLGMSLQVLTALSACEFASRDVPQTPTIQPNLAAIRSRAFATTDREKTLRGIVAALQQLGFVVDRADYALGSVGGAKADRYLLRLTATVLPHGTAELLVRANARYDVTPVLDPEPYEKFFAALSRALALEARRVE